MFQFKDFVGVGHTEGRKRVGGSLQLDILDSLSAAPKFLFRRTFF
jgi:hypothetical protein